MLSVGGSRGGGKGKLYRTCLPSSLVPIKSYYMEGREDWKEGEKGYRMRCGVTEGMSPFSLITLTGVM